MGDHFVPTLRLELVHERLDVLDSADCGCEDRIVYFDDDLILYAQGCDEPAGRLKMTVANVFCDNIADEYVSLTVVISNLMQR